MAEVRGSSPKVSIQTLTRYPGTAKKLKDVIEKLGASKAFIITGQSLSTKTPVIKEAEESLGSSHVGTFNKIGQHAYVPQNSCWEKLCFADTEGGNRPISAIREATELVKAAQADVLISIGGGSPIDSAKAVAYQVHEETGKWIPSIAVPTTLSVAETTQNAGFTTEEKKKIAVSHPELVPKGMSVIKIVLQR